MKKISQLEARRLKRRVAELEQEKADKHNRWKQAYPGGVNLGSVGLDRSGWLQGRLDASRMLGCVIVAVPAEDGKLSLFAVK